MFSKGVRIPLIGLSALCTLASCGQHTTSSAHATPGNAAAPDAPALFTQRPSPTQRLEENGVEKAFMVEAPETGADLGWGWSVNRDQPIPTQCVEFDPRKDDAQETRVSVSEARDSQELARSMDISAEVSVKAIGYSASGKAKFAQETKINSFSTTIVIKADVRNGAEYTAPKAADRNHAGDAVVLSDTAAALARRDPEAFLQTCGAGFVSAKMKGAEAYAVIDIQTRSEQQRQETSSKISGAGWGVKVDGAFKAASSSQSESTKSNITFYQAGGTGNELPSTAEEIKNRIKFLSKDAKEAGKTYALQITPYQVLENFPRGKAAAINAGEDDEIAEAWGLYRTVYDDIGMVFADPAAFELPVARCPAGVTRAADCTVDFKPINADDIGGGVSTMDMLGALQDVALRSLDRIELGAKQCVTPGKECNFDPAALRSSYATRTGLPMPGGWLGKPCAGNDTASCTKKLRAAQIAFQLRDPARERCTISSLAGGCIDNAEIAGWAERTGFVPLAAPDADAFHRATAALKGKTPFISGDADRPRALTLWVPPAAMHAAQDALAGSSTLSKPSNPG